MIAAYNVGQPGSNDDYEVDIDADERYYVNVLDENGFKVPTYVEVDAFVEDKAIIKSGLEGGEEVCAR